MQCLYTAILRKEKVHATISKGIKGMAREATDACLLKESNNSRDSYSTSGTVP